MQTNLKNNYIMRSTYQPFNIVLIGLLAIGMLSTGCRKLFGLDSQTNNDYEQHILDDHIYKSAWQYLNERANGAEPKDTIFRRMLQGIQYAKLDSNLYKQEGRTFIFLHNDAVRRVSGTTIQPDCFFGYFKINNKPGTKWEDYPEEQVKNYLLSLIVDGEYTFGSLGPENITVKTLMPAGASATNPESILLLHIANNSNNKIMINDFPNSPAIVQVRTANIISDNGPIHVVDRVVDYQDF
jgi:hypothetical protein